MVLEYLEVFLKVRNARNAKERVSNGKHAALANVQSK